MDWANKREKMKEFNWIKAERKKQIKRKFWRDGAGPGRPTKRVKTIESDEEEVYFESLYLKENEDSNKIMAELTPWLLFSHQEQGLEGMKEGF